AESKSPRTRSNCADHATNGYGSRAAGMSRIARATVFRSFCRRSNCSESLRPRSTMSLCSLRKPASCTRMYAEYATTTARVITKPKRRPEAGDRSEREDVGTDREYLTATFGG